jgi:hypothetical protein
LICHDSSFTARTVEGDSKAWLDEMVRRGVRGNCQYVWGRRR